MFGASLSPLLQRQRGEMHRSPPTRSAGQCRMAAMYVEKYTKQSCICSCWQRTCTLSLSRTQPAPMQRWSRRTGDSCLREIACKTAGPERSAPQWMVRSPRGPGTSVWTGCKQIHCASMCGPPLRTMTNSHCLTKGRYRHRSSSSRASRNLATAGSHVL